MMYASFDDYCADEAKLAFECPNCGAEWFDVGFGYENAAPYGMCVTDHPAIGKNFCAECAISRAKAEHYVAFLTSWEDRRAEFIAYFCERPMISGADSEGIKTLFDLLVKHETDLFFSVAKDFVQETGEMKSLFIDFLKEVL